MTQSEYQAEAARILVTLKVQGLIARERLRTRECLLRIASGHWPLDYLGRAYDDPEETTANWLKHGRNTITFYRTWAGHDT